MPPIAGKFMDWLREQERICVRQGVNPFPVPDDSTVGIAQNVKEGLQPVNGLRLRPAAGTCGWYLWAGDQFSDAADFFVPLCARHLPEWCAAAMPYLLLPPGWRFLVAPDYEDVWFDEKIVRETRSP
jgi:hypothetical protein